MISKLEAVAFLQRHQPMSGKEQVDGKCMEKYEEVRRFFIENPDEECIPLFLNSFGGKDGLGVYQLVEDVLLMYNTETVLPYLLQSLNSSNDSIKYWSIQIASNFPDSRLFTPFSKLLQHQDEDIKVAVIIALAQLALNDIYAGEIVEMLTKEYESTSSTYVKEFCNEVLADLQTELNISEKNEKV